MRIITCAVLLALCASPVFAAESSRACEAKRQNIESQLSEAQSRGQTRQAAGLKRALQANLAHCTNASLAKERDARILQARKKVAARERSVAQAERKGDPKKVLARKAKLDQARSDLAEAENSLPR